MTSALIRKPFTLLLSVAMPALAWSGSASAQTAEPSGGDQVGLEEIVVTARKREENLQDVSSSISALGASELARRFDSDVRDFANSSPNVIIDDTQQGPGGVAATTIRGIGVADVEKSVDPAVGVVLDDIYLGTSSGNLVKAIDIDRVEVLRGPQGTLFGRNAIGGVINLGRSRPTKEFTGKFRGTYANHNSLDLEGLVSFGLGDVAAVKLTAAHRRTDGYFFNRTLNQDAQRSHFSAIGAQLLLTPMEKLEISLSYDHQHTRQDPPQLQNLAKPTDAFCGLFGQCRVSLTVPQSGNRYVSLGDGPLSKNAFFDMDLAIGKVKWSFDDTMDLQYIFGHLKTDEEITQDFDSTPLTLYHTDRPAKYKQSTHELRLSKGGDGPLTFVVGAYFWDSKYKIDLISYIGFIDEFFGTVPPGTVLAIPQTVRQTNKSYAGFFEADYRFTDKLKLTIGGRYTKDKKSSGVTDLGFGPNNNLNNPERADWSKFTPKVSLGYNVSDDVLLYGLFSRGYRTGGFTGRPTSENTAKTPYNPETVDNFELGFKSQFLENRVRLNAAAFLMKYKDKQEDVDVPQPSGTGRENRTINASKAEIKGLEFDVTAIISDNFSMSGNLGYLDAKYKKFLADTNNDGVIDDNTNLKLRRAPKWNYTVSARYEQELGQGSGWVQADLHFIGAHEITFLNNPALRNPGQYLMDASVNYKLENTQISIFGKNLFKEDGWTIGYDIQGLWSYGTPRPPRVWGVAITQTF
jgi:iron complex outermembrane recepter protein